MFYKLIKRKDWILLDEDGYGEALWEETSRLFWCGGDTYAIVFDRNAYGVPRKEIIIFYNGAQVKEAWENEQAAYDYYRTA